MKALDQYSGTVALLIVIGTFAAAALVAAVGRLPEPAIIQPTAPLPIIIATSLPTVPPTPDTTMLQEIAALKARVAELEAERSVPAPEPVYVEMAAPQAAPTMPPPPEASGPQLQTLSAPTGDEEITPAQLREAMDQ